MGALRQIAVRIEGEWQPVAYVGRAEWRGIARADEPITALALGRDVDGLHWARVGRGGSNELALRLSVQPGASDSRKDVVIHMIIQPPGRRDSTGVAMLQRAVQLTSTAPFMFSFDHATTGAPFWFARAWSDADIRFGALFVAEADTRSARNHLWHLREGFDGPDVRLTAALGYGRKGEIPPG